MADPGPSPTEQRNRLIRDLPWEDGLVDASGWQYWEPTKPRPFRSQETLQTYDAVIRGVEPGKRWEDPDAPGVQWAWPERVWDPAAHPAVYGEASADIQTGACDTGWFIADLCTVALSAPLFEALLTDHNESLGVYCFRFILPDGTPRRVCVDARVPTKERVPLYTGSIEPGVLWPMLVEKALAKLLGSYAAIEGGLPGEGLGLLVGLPGRIYSRQRQLGREMGNPDELWAFIAREGLILAVAFRHDDTGPLGGGLYPVMGTFRVNGRRLVRFRNPWGHRYRWRGPWSDASHKWAGVSLADRMRVGFLYGPDGTFFMPVEDVAHRIEIIAAVPC